MIQPAPQLIYQPVAHHDLLDVDLGLFDALDGGYKLVKESTLVASCRIAAAATPLALPVPV